MNYGKTTAQDEILVQLTYLFPPIPPCLVSIVAAITFIYFFRSSIICLMN